MKSLFTSVFLLSTFIAFSQTFTSDLGGGSGNWDDPATWGNGSGGAGVGYPGSGDNVVITGGDDVSYNITSGSVTYGSLTLGTTGSSFQPQTSCSPSTFSSFTDVSGTSISSSAGSGLVTINDDVTLNGSFLLAGSILINGSFDMQGSLFVLNSAVDIEINSSNGTTTLDGTISISSGTLSLTAGGSNDVDIAASASITIGNGGAMHFEGNGSQHINNAGTITVQSGGLIAITGSNNITFTNSGTTTFEYGSAFYPGVTGAKITTASNAPNWEIDLTSDGSGHWRQVGFPFEAGSTLALLNGSDFNPNISSGQRNIYYYDADEDTFNPGKAYGWTDVGDLSSSAAYSSYGAYNIYTGDANYPFSNGGVVSISASIPDNVDSRSFTLYNTDDPLGNGSDDDQGWNMVFNPFSCWVDLELMMDDNSALDYQGVHVWDAANDQYIAYLANGASLISHSNGFTAGSSGAQYINPFQAFWVKLDPTNDGATETFTVSLSNSSLSNSGTGYLKTNVFESKIRLNTYSVQDSAWDQVLIAIEPNSSYDRVGSEDAYDRTPGFEVPNMSLISTDAVPMAISTMPLDSSYSVPMSFTNAADGEEYYIDLDQSEYDAAMSLTLEDVKNGTFHDLEAGNYRFTYDANWGGTRFILHLNRGSIGVEEHRQASPTIWVSGEALYIESTTNYGNSTVQVLDMSGRILQSFEYDIPEGRFSLPLPKTPSGAHVIRVIPEFGTPIQIKHLAQ